MTRSDDVLRTVSEEVARCVVSAVVGGCIAIWSTLLTIVVSPTILDLPARGFLRFYFSSAGLASLFFYILVARRFKR